MTEVGGEAEAKRCRLSFANKMVDSAACPWLYKVTSLGRGELNTGGLDKSPGSQVGINQPAVRQAEYVAGLASQALRSAHSRVRVLRSQSSSVIPSSMPQKL